MTLIDIAFYMNCVFALLTTALAMSRSNAVHALCYFVLSVISLGISYMLLGAPLIAALQVIVYAGAIMVLFVFVVMLLNIWPEASKNSSFFKNFGLALALSSLLFVELLVFLGFVPSGSESMNSLSVKDIALSLFVPYGLCIEIGSLILLAGLVGAYYIARRHDRSSS